ncbi:MAG TPA: hypothetical protein VMU32_12125 [Solirubrobacteraceae bacterium]|nr:hypothetical protein [Solirubrobacteraceae bacterium]
MSLVRGFATSGSGGGHEPPALSEPDPRYVGAPASQAGYPQPRYASYLPFALPMSWSRPSDVSRVLAGDTDARYRGPGYRWDSRAPEEIRAAGGFHARGTGTDLRLHQRGGTYLAGSGLISFARSRGGTQEVRNVKRELGAAPGYTYEVEHLDPSHTFDTAAFGRLFPAQEEVASARPVGAAGVRSVIDHDRGTRINWPFTPRSDLSDREFQTPVQEDEAAFTSLEDL